MSALIGFGLGLLVGGPFGFAVAAIVAASRDEHWGFEEDE